MNYSIQYIKTLSDCDAILSIAAAENYELVFKKLQQERQYKSVSAGYTTVDDELIGVNAEITGFEAAISAMPQKPVKEMFEGKLIKLRHRRFMLEERKGRFGIAAVLKCEYNMACFQFSLAENERFAQQVMERRDLL